MRRIAGLCGERLDNGNTFILVDIDTAGVPSLSAQIIDESGASVAQWAISQETLRVP